MAIQEHLGQHGPDKARPDVQAAVAAASSSRSRVLPQHRGFLLQPAASLKRQSLDTGA